MVWFSSCRMQAGGPVCCRLQVCSTGVHDVQAKEGSGGMYIGGRVGRVVSRSGGQVEMGWHEMLGMVCIYILVQGACGDPEDVWLSAECKLMYKCGMISNIWQLSKGSCSTFCMCGVGGGGGVFDLEACVHIAFA